MVVVAIVTITFIIIGDINKLAPIVTMPFLITYASIDYSYFALAQTFDLQHRREMRFVLISYFNLILKHFANSKKNWIKLIYLFFFRNHFTLRHINQ